MTPDHLLKIAKHYRDRFDYYRPERALEDWAPASDEIMPHVRWMLDEIPKLVDQGKIETAHMWLGFIQGVLWCEGFFPLSQLKRHIKQKEE